MEMENDGKAIATEAAEWILYMLVVSPSEVLPEMTSKIQLCRNNTAW